jgi:hypothetical protein
LAHILAFLSIDGIKCVMLMFRGRTELSHEIFLLFEGHLKKVLYGYLCHCIYPKAALEFLTGIFIARVGI